MLSFSPSGEAELKINPDQPSPQTSTSYIFSILLAKGRGEEYDEHAPVRLHVCMKMTHIINENARARAREGQKSVPSCKKMQKSLNFQKKRLAKSAK